MPSLTQTAAVVLANTARGAIAHQPYKTPAQLRSIAGTISAPPSSCNRRPPSTAGSSSKAAARLATDSRYRCFSAPPAVLSHLSSSVFCAQGGFKTWKKRWFVLSRDELTYYAQPSRKDLKGVMNITDCVVEHSPPTQVQARAPLPAKTPASFYLRADRLSLLHQRAHGGTRIAAPLQQRRRSRNVAPGHYQQEQHTSTPCKHRRLQG
jgi:hypothetical protein